MTIQSDLTETWQEKEERQDLFTARAALENLTNVLLEELARFEEIKNSGSFATLPTDLLQAFVRWEMAYKDVKTLLLADQEIVDIYQWRP